MRTTDARWRSRSLLATLMAITVPMPELACDWSEPEPGLDLPTKGVDDRWGDLGAPIGSERPQPTSKSRLEAPSSIDGPSAPDANVDPTVEGSFGGIGAGPARVDRFQLPGTRVVETQRREGEGEIVTVEAVPLPESGDRLHVRVVEKIAPGRARVEQRAVADQLLVALDEGANRDDLAAMVELLDGTLTAPSPYFFVVHLPSPSIDGYDLARHWLASTAGVRYAEPVYLLRSGGLLSGTFGSQQWPLQNLGGTGKIDADIDAPSAWLRGADCRSVRVGVLDSGVDIGHPDLAANIYTNTDEDHGPAFRGDLYGFNAMAITDPLYFPSVKDVADLNGHGTHVAGTIGARGLGVDGVCPQATIVPIKAGWSFGLMPSTAIIIGIDYAIAARVKVLNASFGGAGWQQALWDAFARAGNADMFVAVAAGNDGVDVAAATVTPAIFGAWMGHVLTVAASDRQDQLASFSNFGESVQIAAPGGGVPSTISTVLTYVGPDRPLLPCFICREHPQVMLAPGYAVLSGTSMAAPHVAGAAALLRALEPSLTAVQVKQRLIEGGELVRFSRRVGPDPQRGRRLNVAKAVGYGRQAASVDPAQSPTFVVSDGAYVDLLYRALLRREPDAAGYQAHVAMLAQGRSRSVSFFDDFGASQEFAAVRAQITHEELVTTLYRNLLQREPDQGSYDYWRGASLSAVLNGIYWSTEFQARFRYAPLTPGQRLEPGQSRSSPDGRFTFVQQTDGNLVLYWGSTPLWWNGLGGANVGSTLMQTDGNLVTYSRNGVPLWWTGTSGRPGAYLSVQSDGNVVVYAGGAAIWSTGTCCH